MTRVYLGLTAGNLEPSHKGWLEPTVPDNTMAVTIDGKAARRRYYLTAGHAGIDCTRQEPYLLPGELVQWEVGSNTPHIITTKGA